MNVRNGAARPGPGSDDWKWQASVVVGAGFELVGLVVTAGAWGRAAGVAGTGLIALGLFLRARVVERRFEAMDLRLLITEGRIDRNDKRIVRLVGIVEHDVSGPSR